MDRSFSAACLHSAWLLCLAGAGGLLLPSGEARAATRVVSNCSDSGAGSLRQTIALADSGDTIDLSGLTCTAIRLTSGMIFVPQENLYLLGRSRTALTIDAGGLSRVFWHAGPGVFRLTRLTVANGLSRSNVAEGGCIRSNGAVELVRSSVHRCLAEGQGGLEPEALGGGIFARREVRLSWSSVYFNRATSGGLGYGGGVAVFGGPVIAYRSQVYGNRADEGAGLWSSLGTSSLSYSLVHGNNAVNVGGGLSTWGGVTILKSTVSANTARAAGGINVREGAGRTVLLDSTVSGNRAVWNSAGRLSDDTTIANSTIAFNVETDTATACRGAVVARDLLLVSSIVARNACAGGAAFDIGGSSSAGDAVVGSNNLVQRSRLPLPADTIAADTRLAPLANNGGPTRTHLLLSDSPAIDRGYNPFDRAYDQRGPGFVRIKGADPDIGAIER